MYNLKRKKEFIDKPTKYDMYHEFKQEISKYTITEY